MFHLLRVSSLPGVPLTQPPSQSQVVDSLLSLSLRRIPSVCSAYLSVRCALPSGTSARFSSHLPTKDRSLTRFSFRRIRCANDGDNLSSISGAESGSFTVEGGRENRSHTSESGTSNETLMKLKRYGLSGILSYGLLNTAYYLTTFLLVWFYFAPAPGKMGYLASVERFLKVMAMVWAGSQVTKLIRAAGALALAPFVDQGLSWFVEKYQFESRQKAFFAVVASCIGLAVVLFLAVTLVSA